MSETMLNDCLAIAAFLFTLGLVGVLVRRNLLYVLMSIEVMLNAAALSFVAAGARWGGADGQVVFVLVLTVAAAEAAVGLALLLLARGKMDTLNADSLSMLRG